MFAYLSEKPLSENVCSPPSLVRHSHRLFVLGFYASVSVCRQRSDSTVSVELKYKNKTLWGRLTDYCAGIF